MPEKKKKRERVKVIEDLALGGEKKKIHGSWHNTGKEPREYIV